LAAAAQLSAGLGKTPQRLSRTRCTRDAGTVTPRWYDLAVTVEEDAQFRYHFAGHLENGEDSISDPIMGGLV
jgi:hypothetical protein